MWGVYYEWDFISKCFRHFHHFSLPGVRCGAGFVVLEGALGVVVTLNI